MPLINNKFEPLEIPEKHAGVLLDQSKPWRYRALYGGRNGAKDWSMAAVIVEMAIRKPIRVLFTREIQQSIKESIYQLTVDTIQRLGYNDYYTILSNEIRGKQHKSSFIFKGLRDINADDIKSYEAIDIAVICEAQSLTKKSFDILDPTIRKDNSEIWFQFNPKFDDDFVYDFCIINPPDNLIGAHVNYTDNPWTNDVIRKQAERKRLTDYHAYLNTWGGQPIGQGGRVLPMYDPSIHEIEFDYNMLPQCNLYMAIDPHRKYYPAIKWYSVTPTKTVVVYNEWPRYHDLDMWYDEARNNVTFDMTLQQLANVILANDLTLQYGGYGVTRVGDPRFLAENIDFVRSLMECGVVGWVDAPFERIETQRNNLREMMDYNPALPLSGINYPDWFVDRDRCRNTSRMYKRHCWSDDKDRESEECKDFIDCDRYFLSIVDGRPLYKEPVIHNTKIAGGGIINPLQHLSGKTSASAIRKELKKDIVNAV